MSLSLHAEPVTWDDYDEILTVLQNCKDDLVLEGTKVIGKDLDANKALRFLYQHAYMFFVEGYLVCYVIDVPWFTDKPTLIEMLVVRVRSGGRFHHVTQFLEQQAKLHQCNYAAVGTMLAASDTSLAALYGRHGYSVGAIQLIKEIDLCASA